MARWSRGMGWIRMRLPQRTGAGVGGNKAVPESQAISVVGHKYVVHVLARKLLFYFFFKQVELLKLFIHLFLFLGHTLWHIGSYFPDQGSNPCPLHWKYRILTT